MESQVQTCSPSGVKMTTESAMMMASSLGASGSDSLEYQSFMG